MFKYTTLLALTYFACAAAASGFAAEEEKIIQEGFLKASQEAGAIIFTPPQGWHLAEAKALPKNVQVMVVGESTSNFPPSINLSSEPFKGTLKQYLKIIKTISDSKGSQWKDLGAIQTAAGEASLSQTDNKTNWGDVKLMHVIVLKDETIYILTASALKDEFPKYYKDFFSSLKSLRFN